MKKFLVIFIGLIMIAPAWATGESETTYPGAAVASPAYVKGAYDALNTAKMNQLQNNASTPADISATVKTSIGTAGENGTASDTSMVTEKAVATALAGKIGSVADDANNASGAPVVTAVTQSGTTVTVTKGEITIPVTSYSQPTAHAQIWLQ